MPTTNQSPANRLRAVVTATTPLAASQLARDLSTDSSLQISFATSEVNLWQEIDAVNPNIVLLDTRISGNHSPQLVAELVERKKLPVLIRTELGENAPEMLVDCIAAGALGILNKPMSVSQNAEKIPALLWNLKAASSAAINKLSFLRCLDWAPATGGDAESIIAIGSGMGSAIALENLLTQLPAGAPGVVAVTSLPVQIIRNWANRVHRRCQVQVKQACDGDRVQPGQVLIAPGETHLLLQNHGSDWTVKIKDGPAVFHQKPSIEILFNSLAETSAPRAVGVLLGGSGVDGIAGLLNLRNAGGRTLTESSNTSLLADLPNRAIQCGAAEHSATANQLASRMLELTRTQRIPQAA